MRVAGGMASARKSRDRASGSRPSANRVQPRSSARVSVRRGRHGERHCRRVEPEVEHVHDPDVDTGRHLRRQADAVLGIRRVEGLGAVVADDGVPGKVTENEHRVGQVVPLRQDGPHMGGRAPAAEQRRSHARRPELGGPEVGDGGRQHLPFRSTVSLRDETGGPSEQRQQIAAIGLVAHGPEVVDAGAEHVAVVGVVQRRDRIEGQILGLGHAGDPTGSDDGA